MESFTSDFRKLMEKYQQELRDLQQRSTVAEQPKPPLKPVTVPVEAPVSAPTQAFTAPLTVRVTAANEAIPIADALVVVTRQENGQSITEATRLTNPNGLTESIILSAADPALTLTPNTALVPIVHDVTVSAPGYYRTNVRNIPLYGGIPTELPISLIPLPEFSDGDELNFDTPPIQL